MSRSRIKTGWKPASKDLIREEKYRQEMTEYERLKAAQEANREAREDQAHLVLATLAGLCSGKHQLVIEKDGAFRQTIRIEPRS